MDAKLKKQAEHLVATNTKSELVELGKGLLEKDQRPAMSAPKNTWALALTLHV